MKPKVTIAICVRNSQQFVREAISSILDQDFPHDLMEVIFVDDGDEDETLSIINSYVPRMDVKVNVFHKNGGDLGCQGMSWWIVPAETTLFGSTGHDIAKRPRHKAG